MELIGMPLSPFVKKCEVILHEKNIAFHYQQISPLIDQDQYFEHSPTGKMPILLDGDFALPDSSAIAVYLDGIAPEPALIPADPAQRAWVIWLEEYSDSVLLPLSSGLFFARFIGPRLMGLPVDEDGAAAIVTNVMPPAFDYLEKQLSAAGEYLAPPGYSLADIAVAAQICMMRLAGESIDAARWPLLAAWFERVCARPAFQKCLTEEARFFDIWQTPISFCRWMARPQRVNWGANWADKTEASICRKDQVNGDKGYTVSPLPPIHLCEHMRKTAAVFKRRLNGFGDVKERGARLNCGAAKPFSAFLRCRKMRGGVPIIAPLIIPPAYGRATQYALP